MKPISKKMRTTGEIYLKHNTKADIRTLAEYCNMLADKINELNDEVENLRKELKPVKDDCK